MAKTHFVLHETFQSETMEQRKVRFQELFARYIVRQLTRADP